MYIKSKIWTLAKGAGAAFNALATWDVFYSILSDSYGSIIAAVGTILAIFLIDCIMLALMQMIEKPLMEHELYRYRRPYADSLIVLCIGILLIGFKSEGLLAFAPRIGVLVLVYVDLRWFYAVYKDEKITLWESDYEHRKRKAEREDQLKLSQQMRKIKHQEETRALESKRELLREKYMRNFDEKLGLVEKDEPVEYAELPIHQVSTPILNTSNGHNHSNELAEYVYPTKKGYGWECPHCGTRSEKTALGKPYKERGAKISFTNHLNQCQPVPQSVN